MPEDRETTAFVSKRALEKGGAPAKWHYEEDCHNLDHVTSGVITTNKARVEQLADRAGTCCSLVDQLGSHQEKQKEPGKKFR